MDENKLEHLKKRLDETRRNAPFNTFEINHLLAKIKKVENDKKLRLVRGIYQSMHDMTQVFWARQRRSEGIEEVFACEDDIKRILLLWNRMGDYALPLFGLIKLDGE